VILSLEILSDFFFVLEINFWDLKDTGGVIAENFLSIFGLFGNIETFGDMTIK
jgi:hypothetical protein